MTFGDKIKQLRNEKGLTQTELAKMVGCTKQTILSYENNGKYPRKREVYSKLADALGVATTYLLTENESFMTEVGEQFGRRGQVQAQEVLKQTRELFAGGSLSDQDQIAFLTEMQQIFLDSKKKAKEKYTPKKYRKEDTGVSEE